MEPRFGYDFSGVRLHMDGQARASARVMNAQAYTVGNDVVFRDGNGSMRTKEEKMLLAHELTHVVQQNKNAIHKKAIHNKAIHGSSITIGPQNDAAETEAEKIAHRTVSENSSASPGVNVGAGLQRRMTVDDPRNNIPNPGGSGLVQTNAATVEGYLTTLCSSGSVSADAGTGVVSIDRAFCTQPTMAPGEYGPPAPSGAQSSRQPAGCGCICDMVYSGHHWTIEVDDANWPHTTYDSDAAAVGRPPGGTGGRVTTPSPNSPKLWGAATVRGRALNIDPWLVLGHELCGHAWLGNTGSAGPDIAQPRGEGGHQATVARENELRAEHGIELRGTHRDPNCGESFWRDRTRPGRVNWSSFRAVCERWRREYNRRHGTRYGITDRIP